MVRNHPKFRAAAVQSASVLHDLDGGIEKAISIIEDAARQDVDLLAFPEAWVPGYPYWAWLGPPAWGMQFVQAYHDNSMEVGSAQHNKICAAAQRHNMHVVFGFSEKAGGSVYLAQTIIGPDGQVIANRRKLRPTHVERSVFGDGDGSNLAVHDTELGKLGALCCWEHLQPLSKYAMYSMGEHINTGDFSGSLTDLRSTVEHHTFKNVGFGFGINRFDLDLTLEDPDTGFVGSLNNNWSGLLVYVTVYGGIFNPNK